jgi:predicted nucleic acid-binding protein
MTDKTPDVAKEIQPTATAGEVGISSLVRAELAKGKLNPEINRRIAEHLAKKGD